LNNNKQLSNVYPTRKEIVLQKIREDLLSEKLKPEEVLNISVLAKKYNVSITPVREALTYLESLGLVEKDNYKNIKVAKFLSDEVEEIYYIRASLSGIAARSAAMCITKKDQKELGKIIEEEKAALKDRHQEDFLDANMRFHGLLSSYIKTPFLRELNEQFYIITKRYQIFGYKMRSYEELSSEHENIYTEVLKGNAEKAEEYGRLHYIRNIEFMRAKVHEKNKNE